MAPVAQQTPSDSGRASEIIAAVPTSSATAVKIVAPAVAAPVAPAPAKEDSLFEHFAWLYIFFRECIFRDDTRRIVRRLWPREEPEAGERLIELGCGPGFYSCKLARRFRQLDVLGVDQSPRQLERAREKARRWQLRNARFESFDVVAIPKEDGSFDSLVASRLFTILEEPRQAVAEMHRVLAAGGRCFVAEPRYAFWASIPLFVMRLLARLTGFQDDCEPEHVRILSREAFRELFATQPWRSLKVWTRGRYQYALCEKR